MKFTQHARLTPEWRQQQQELQAIKMPSDPTQPFAALAEATYARLVPEALTPAAKKAAWAGIAVDAKQNLADWLTTEPTAMTQAEFYTVALQLLRFTPQEADLTQPVATMQNFNLPVFDTPELSGQAFLEAIYLLLNTRTPHVVTLIDDLAGRGFYRDFPSVPLIFNGKAQQVFAASQVVRERVWIEADFDTDEDGQRDLLEATIYRPAATEDGLQVPVLFTANPYFRGTNPVEAATHVPADVLAVKHGPAATVTEPALKTAPPRPVLGHAQEAAAYGDEASIYSLNDYFLARGFAVVYSAGVGTLGSDGVRSTGGASETAGAVAVIEWLTGKRRAFTDRTSHIAIDAWWSSGQVAMTGKSYLGTLAIAAATTGVPGLKTIIAEAGISSWYDYYRENGLVVAPGGYQGEDADVLAVDTFSRLKSAGEMQRVAPVWEKALDAIAKGQDRTTGDYTEWWAARNYRNHAANITCDVVLVHGLNDWNVKPANATRLWTAIQDLPIAKKLFLHQGEHVYLNNVRSLDFTDQMNLWLTHELLGVDNGATDQLPNVTIQDNVQPETWVTAEDFGGGAPTTLNLVQDFKANQDRFEDHSTAIFKAKHHTSAEFEAAIVAPTSVYADSRLWLTTAPFVEDQIIEGVPELTLRLAIDQPTGILSVRLVDLGSARRLGVTANVVGRAVTPLGYGQPLIDALEFEPAATTANKLITLGHINLQNQEDAAHATTITPGKFFTIKLALQPTHYHLPAGRQLALVIHGADQAQTQRPTVVTGYRVDMGGSVLKLPIQ